LAVGIGKPIHRKTPYKGMETTMNILKPLLVVFAALVLSAGVVACSGKKDSDSAAA
jgi:hypothetical protein